MMGHDYAHCEDYDEATCPPECFRGQLVKDYRARLETDFAEIPVSWMHLRGKEQCMLTHNIATYVPARTRTNGDRIRAGTDDEIVDVILNECTGRRCLKPDGTLYDNCRDCWIDWLKQEVQE